MSSFLKSTLEDQQQDVFSKLEISDAQVPLDGDPLETMFTFRNGGGTTRK
jgi:hypothetical protein